MVTWNVNDNADPKMGGTDDKANKIGYDEKDIEEVLGITKGGLVMLYLGRMKLLFKRKLYPPPKKLNPP